MRHGKRRLLDPSGIGYQIWYFKVPVSMPVLHRRSGSATWQAVAAGSKIWSMKRRTVEDRYGQGWNRRSFQVAQSSHASPKTCDHHHPAEMWKTSNWQHDRRFSTSLLHAQGLVGGGAMLDTLEMRAEGARCRL